MRTDTSYAPAGQTEKDKRRPDPLIFPVALNFLPIHRTNRDRGTVTVDFVRGIRTVFFKG